MAKATAHIEMEISDEVIKNFTFNLVPADKLKDIEEFSIEIEFGDFGGIIKVDTEKEKDENKKEG